MAKVSRAILLLLISLHCDAAHARKLLVISVDGLDWRYLHDCDALGLRIENVRRLLEEGEYADGVVGVWPSITWPSHTSIITGARPDQHGILGNRRPKSEGGDYYWTAALLKAPTLWQAAHKHRMKTASVTWPVTADAEIDYNLPEYFFTRQGGEMDLDGVASKSSPGLIDEISTAFPSFPQHWVDDRTRTLAVLYLLRTKKPDLILVHLVDLDSEEHEQGPFTKNAKAVLEYTDELIGEMLTALPAEYSVALVSDHGFERVDYTANVRVLLSQNRVQGQGQPLGGIVTTEDERVAQFLRRKAHEPNSGIGREIPHAELIQYAPDLAHVAAAFEPAEHILFGAQSEGPYLTPAYEKGNHGFWPERRDYRSIFILWGPGIKRGNIGQIQMLSIAGRLAEILQIPFPDSRPGMKP